MRKWVNETFQNRQHASPEELRVYLVLLVLIMILAMSFVWPNVKAVKMAYDYQVLAKEQQSLERENNMLQLEIGSLTNLNRIQTIAQTQIGLRYPENDQIVTIFLK